MIKFLWLAFANGPTFILSRLRLYAFAKRIHKSDMDLLVVSMVSFSFTYARCCIVADNVALNFDENVLGFELSEATICI